MGKYKPFFKLNHFKVFAEQSSDGIKEFTSSVMINVTVDGKEQISAAEGEGPVNALDKALRKSGFQPVFKGYTTKNHKVVIYLGTEELNYYKDNIYQLERDLF